MALLQSMSGRARDYLRLGTDRRRRLYEGSRSLLHHRACAARRRVAGELAGRAGFTIGPDLGFSVFTPEHFPEVPAIVEHARALVSGCDPTRTVQPRVTTEGAFVHLLRPQQLHIGSPYLAFALRPDVVAAVSNYLGMVPVLAQVDVWYSQHCPRINNSQLFHCDWSATRQVKVFLYASDVVQASGPLTLVEAQHSRMIRAALKYDYNRNGRRYRVDDQRMRLFGAGPHTHVLTGPAGTACFADTSQCFHYGSRVAAGADPRIMVLFQFLLPGACQFPLHFEQGAPFRKLAYPNLPEYQRLILGGR